MMFETIISQNSARRGVVGACGAIGKSTTVNVQCML